jgi:predicted phosphoribosyltransferase
LLAQKLAPLELKDAIIYALPRGGVPVALEIAQVLKARLDLSLVRKIGAPGHPELALAAVVDGDRPHVVVNENVQQMTGASAAYIEREGARELAEIERRRALYLGGRPRPDPRGRTVVVVDDGLATGATARAAIQALRGLGAAPLILATPVAPRDVAAAMRAEVDELICLLEPVEFWGVGSFYDDFHQLTDAEVLRLLDQAAAIGLADPGGAPRHPAQVGAEPDGREPDHLVQRAGFLE